MDHLEQLQKSLKAQGNELDALLIEAIRNTAWSHRSHMMAQLGLTILGIQKRYKRSLSPATKMHMKACLREVRKDWPLIGREKWIWTLLTAAIAIYCAIYLSHQ